MIQSVTDLQGDEILARDGAIGSVDDVYFDDERWAVRYLVVDTGAWIPGKRVLISPASVDVRSSSGRAVRVDLTREQVKNAPGPESDRPVSRQYEAIHAAYFGYPPYWSGPFLWGQAAVPVTSAGLPPTHAGQAEAMREARAAIKEGDPHLRSCREVIGYAIEARDGPIGEVEDFIVDELSWAIRDLVVDTRVWWPGGHVHVAPGFVERVDWGERKVYVRLARDEVRKARRLAGAVPGGMKQSLRDLKRDRLLAADGVIGFIQDVYFDDQGWTVRYLLVDIGTLLPGRRVLIPPAATEEGSMSDPNGTTVRVKLTRDEIRNSPSQPDPGDIHLRSGRDLIGYDIQARDGAVGEVQDLLIDDATWAISDVVIDTRKWWPGGHVHIAPDRVERIDLGARRVLVRMTREEIRASPPV